MATTGGASRPAAAPSPKALTAQGIFGQFVYVNSHRNVVAAIWSAWPQAWVPASEDETYPMLNKAMAMLG
jgi:hypothetical protein